MAKLNWRKKPSPGLSNSNNESLTDEIKERIAIEVEGIKDQEAAQREYEYRLSQLESGAIEIKQRELK
jgi:hypothetical protein